METSSEWASTVSAPKAGPRELALRERREEEVRLASRPPFSTETKAPGDRLIPSGRSPPIRPGEIQASHPGGEMESVREVDFVARPKPVRPAELTISHPGGESGAGSDPALGRRPKPKRKAIPRGRARLEKRDKSIEATKPWLAEGMSRRTWYRRRAERREGK